MKDEQWITELRRRMADYEKPAPDGLWDSIEDTLSEVDARPLSPLQRIRPLWRYASAIAAVILLVVLIGHNLRFDNQPTRPAYTATDNPQSDSASNVPQSTPTVPIISHATKRGKTIAATHVIKTNDATSDNIIQQTETSDPESDNAKPSVTESDNNSGLQESTPPATPSYKTKSGSTTLLAITSHPNKKSGKLSARINVSGQPRATTYSHGYSGLVAGYAATAEVDNRELPEAGNPLCELMRHNFDKEVHTDTKHYQPIKAGISLCYNLTDRLALETGMTYAYLLSSTTSGSNDYRFTSDQKLHYIGIPLGLNYTFLQSNRFSLYVSAGASVEKCVAGRIDTDYINCGTVTKSDSEHFRPKELQWSTNIGAGIQYNITPGIGLYAEPGMSYYFDNGRANETFYTKKPLKFNIEAGLRFSFSK